MNFDKNTNKVINFTEKPQKPKVIMLSQVSTFDNKVINYAGDLTPSNRNELEITDIFNRYLGENNIKVQVLGTGIAWLDTGTFSLQEAGTFIRTLEKSRD